jgi:CMP-N-acetylneuraminic acid synthetase
MPKYSIPPKPSFVAVIPARGGSKRLPRKNILDLAGKPLIAWTIAAGLESKYVQRVVVSTEDEEIARVSRQYGADVPFIRPEALAGDDAPSIEVLKHALAALAAKGERYDYAALLQPTSPLRNAAHIDAAIELLLAKRADAVVSVTELDHPAEWSNTLPEDLSLDGFIPVEYRGLRSQDLPKRYRLNGAIYISRIERMLQENALLYDGNSFAYIMDRQVSVDIDSDMDFLLAGILARHQGKSAGGYL